MIIDRHPSKNEKNSLLNLLINWISARTTIQFLNFLIIGLCNSSANSWFDILSFLIPPPQIFLSKDLKTIEAIPS